MKLFVKRFSIFAIPILIILLLQEYGVRQIPNSYKLKTHYLNDRSAMVETLILGSSHSFYGVNPLFLDSKAFNASNVSQSPDIDFAILKSYEDHFEQLKTVVIRLSYDTLFEQLKDSPEDWRLKDYKIYTDIKFDYKFKHNFEILSIGGSRILKVFKNYYLNDKSLLNCDSLGWGNDLSDRPDTNLEIAGISAAKRHTIKNWELVGTNIKVLRELNDWCAKRGVRVILVTLPAYKSYSTNLDKDQLNKMIEVGTELDSEFNNCTYYNFMTHKDFTKDDFYDADHLSPTGAYKFSLIMNNLIEK
jgi:hypothetical protein